MGPSGGSCHSPQAGSMQAPTPSKCRLLKKTGLLLPGPKSRNLSLGSRLFLKAQNSPSTPGSTKSNYTAMDTLLY